MRWRTIICIAGALAQSSYALAQTHEEICVPSYINGKRASIVSKEKLAKVILNQNSDAQALYIKRSGFSEASTLFSPILLGLALDEQIVESVWSGLRDWGLREIQLNIARVPQGHCLIACPHTQHERAHGRAPVPFLYFVHIVRPQLVPSIGSLPLSAQYVTGRAASTSATSPTASRTA